jgi:hypothetical protein
MNENGEEGTATTLSENISLNFETKESNDNIDGTAFEFEEKKCKWGTAASAVEEVKSFSLNVMQFF